MSLVPKPFMQENPSVLRVREGGGCLSIFGLPFFVAGVWLLGIGTGLIHLNQQPPVEGVAKVIMAIMGVIFSGVGGTLVFGRKWIVIDKVRRQLVLQYGFLLPMKRDVFSLGDFTKVLLALERGDSDSSDRYHVRLLGKEKGGAQNISNALIYGQAREQALFLSGFLHLPLEDASTGEVQTEKAVSASGEGQGALPSSSEETEEGATLFPTRPMQMSCTVEEGPSGVKITLPTPKMAVFNIIFAFIPALVGYWFFRGAFNRETLDFHKGENAFILFFMGFLALFFVLIPLVTTYRRYRRTKTGLWTATLSREGLKIEDNGSTGTSHQIPLSDILSIETRVVSVDRNLSPLPHNPRVRGHLVRLMERQNALLVKTKQDIFTFALGLPKEEMDYIRAVLVRRLAAAR